MCKCVRDADRLDSLKPLYTENDVSEDIKFKKGSVDLQCTRFKTRIRQSDSQVSFMSSFAIVSDRRDQRHSLSIVAHSVQNRTRKNKRPCKEGPRSSR